MPTASRRVILSVLYIMTEVLRSHEDQRLRDGFTAELNVPMEGGGSSSGSDGGGAGGGGNWGELLAVRLLSMVTRFCSGSAPHFPMKKVGLGGRQTFPGTDGWSRPFFVRRFSCCCGRCC